MTEQEHIDAILARYGGGDQIGRNASPEACLAVFEAFQHAARDTADE